MPRNAIPPLPLAKRLILNQYVLGLFGKKSFEELSHGVNRPEHEGLSPDRTSHFYHALVPFVDAEASQLDAETLLAYDRNIVSHTLAIQGKRGEPIRWKYFQYLALLFTEIYLDRYMNDSERLLESLNECRRLFNIGKDANSCVDEFSESDLRKLAFWSATGSGKTLIMHMNIKQYWHYLAKANRAREINRILLITPNEGLSQQHKEEFELSGMQADFFSKQQASLFKGRVVEIIEITKLRDEAGDKTVAVDSFENNNLVLVDEGHRGSSAENSDWMKRRRMLASKGFTFEYSATFGQAVAKHKILMQEYAKSILFDYSYHYFYSDGYGKDYRILNLPVSDDTDTRARYLTACLLTFYQQKVLFADMPTEVQSFHIENPLWVFVGASVNAVRTENGRAVSDIVDILLFLASFTDSANKPAIVERIKEIVSGYASLYDAQGNNIFANQFAYLSGRHATPEEIYSDIMREVFNTSGGAASLCIRELKGVDGEIALSIGNNNPFGVINVGDAAKLCGLCAANDSLHVTDPINFSESLFLGINKKDSNINILIGSKKFTEGWSSWRVSTMGLLNVGTSEGSQIIQLFGRGVRLKGYNKWLKRHRAFLSNQSIVEIPNLARLETLNVFGIRANYMDQFKNYLAKEGVSIDNREEIIIPVIKNLGTQELMTIDVQEGQDYKKSREYPLLTLDTELVRHKVTLDYYPRIQSQIAVGAAEQQVQGHRHVAHLKAAHVEFLDMDAIYFDLLAFKDERAWVNLLIDKAQLKEILLDNTWYDVLIPEEQMQFKTFAQVETWQKIACDLLRKYCDSYYKACKSKWEAPRRAYRIIDENDPNFVKEYKVLIDKSQEQIIARLKEIKETIERNHIPTWDINFISGMALSFSRHLYYPLLYARNNDIIITPVALNEGERAFIDALRNFCSCSDNQPFFESNQLYLLRNMSKGRGIGFFEAGNFHPDFILWVLHGNKQYVSFVDPKGIRNLEATDPKFSFCKTIKNIESQMNDKNVILNSFILSVTPHHIISERHNGMAMDELAAQKHLLFQEDETHIQRLINLLKMD